MIAIADIGRRERLFDNLGLMGLELLESTEFFYEWNNFVEDIGKCFIWKFIICCIWYANIKTPWVKNILPKLIGNPPFQSTVRLPVPGCKISKDDDQVYYCVNELGFPMQYRIISGRDTRTVKRKSRSGVFILKDEMNGNWVNLVEQPKLPGFGTFSKLDLSWIISDPDLKNLEKFEIEVVSRWPSGAINSDYSYLRYIFKLMLIR